MPRYVHPYIILAGHSDESGSRGEFVVCMNRHTAFSRLRQFTEAGWSAILEHQGRIRIRIHNAANQAGLDKARQAEQVFRVTCEHCRREHLAFPYSDQCPYCEKEVIPF